MEGTPCLVRLLEISIDDVDIEEDGAIIWPDSVLGACLPKVDGVLTLYDVSDKRSFEDVPETLSKLSPLLYLSF